MKLNTIKNRLAGQKLALSRVRVVQISTNKSGNLVDWLNGKYCRVFIAYESIGTMKLPIFELWDKSDTRLESGICTVLS